MIPRKFPWMPWNIYLSDLWQINKDIAVGRIACAFGRHQAKFDTAPYCYRCEKRAW